jgi:hypothetical protein
LAIPLELLWKVEPFGKSERFWKVGLGTFESASYHHLGLVRCGPSVKK